MIRRFINKLLMIQNWFEIIHIPILQSTDRVDECSFGSQDIAVLQNHPRIYFLLNSFTVTENVSHMFPPSFVSCIPCRLFHKLIWVICLVFSKGCFHPGQEILENWVFGGGSFAPQEPLCSLHHVYIPFFSWLVYSQLRLFCFWLEMHNYKLLFKACYFSYLRGHLLNVLFCNLLSTVRMLLYQPCKGCHAYSLPS